VAVMLSDWKVVVLCIVLTSVVVLFRNSISFSFVCIVIFLVRS